jgi:LmbE family N-acetylglucosaminyl deacetylase
VDIPANGSVVAVMAHPDDIKSVREVVRLAMERGSEAALILTTKGEGLKRPHLEGLTPRQIAARRLRELRSFLRRLGIRPERFFVLGIPDGGPLTAMREDFYDKGPAYYDSLLGVDAVPYKDAVRPGMPLRGEELAAVLDELFAALRPDLVLTHHPYDDHPDHRAIGAFVRRAARRGRRAGRMPSHAVWATLVYCGACRWPPPGDFFLTDEVRGRFQHLPVHQVRMTDEQYAAKLEACGVFMGSLGEDYIRANVKRDEVLWRIQ